MVGGLSFVLENRLFYNVIMLKDKTIRICNLIIDYGFLAIIFIVPVYFAWFQENYNIFELNKLVAFRIILTIILLAYVGKIFILSSIKIRGNKIIFLFTSLLLLDYAISCFLSIHPSLSWWGNYERQQGFYSLANYLLFFTLLLLNLRSLAQVKKIIFTVISAAFIVSLYGIIQHLGLDPLGWKEDALIIGRVFSSLGQPNFLGHYLLLTLPLSWFCLRFVSQKFLPRFLVGITVVAQFYCLILTYSRAAWLGLAAEIFVFLIIWLLVKSYKKIAWSLIGISLLAVIFVIGFNIINFTNKNNLIALQEFTLSNRIKSIVDLNGGSNKIRLYYWRAAIKEIGQETWLRKIVGNGPDTLDSLFVKYYRPEWGVFEGINVYPDRSHNAILDLILAFGFAGLIIVSLFYYFILSRAIRYLTSFNNKGDQNYWLAIICLSVLFGYFINNLFSFSLTVGYLYLYLILGLLAYAINQTAPEKTINFRLASIFKIMIFIAIFFVGGLYILLQNIDPLIADYYYMKVKKAEVKADCTAMLNEMEKVVAYDPVSLFFKERYLYHNLNCLPAVSRNDQILIYDNVLAQINTIDAKDYQYSTLSHLAHAQSLFANFIDPNYYKEAEESYGQLIAINPFFTTSYKDLAKLELWQKNYDRSVDLTNQALAVIPPLASPYLNTLHKQDITSEMVGLYEIQGSAYRYKRNFDQALTAYSKALAIDPHYLPLYKEIADVYYLQGKIDLALKFNLHGYELNPGDAAWPLAISLLYREKKDLVKAEAYDQKAKALISQQ